MNNMNDELEEKDWDDHEGSFIMKVFAGIIDAVFVFGAAFFIGNKIISSSLWNSWTDRSPILVLVIAFIIYRISIILFFNETVGMKITKLHYLNKDYEKLKISEKLLVAIGIPFIGVDVYRKD